VTPSRGLTPNLKLLFLRLNLESTLDERRGNMGVARRRQLKKSSLSEAMTKKGRQIFSSKNRVTGTQQFPPRVTPTLVTPLGTSQCDGALSFSERTSCIWLQAHNATTTTVPCCCTLWHSTGSSNSVTSEFTRDSYYLAD